MSQYKPNISVCVQVMNGNAVYLTRRFNTGYQDGKYEFPAGHIEENESVLEAGVREVYEEIGIQIAEEDLQFVCCADNHTSGKHVNLLFTTNKFIGTPKIMEPDECDDLILKDLSELNSSMDELSIDTRRFLDMILNNAKFRSYIGDGISNQN